MSPRALLQAVGGALVIFFGGDGLRGARAFAQQSTTEATTEATTKVTVIRPTGSDLGLAEIATRAWAELNAGGIAATLLDCAGADDGCGTEAPPPGGNVITLRTFRRADETITEAALTPGGHDRPTVRRSLTVSDEAAADPKVMAIRAVELVNAMLLQVYTAAAENAAALRRAAIADAEYPGQHRLADRDPVGILVPLPDQEGRWSVGAGGSFLKGSGGLSEAFGFAIRVSRSITRRVGVSALLTEAPSRTDTATIDGSLALNQQLGALEVTARSFRIGRLIPHLAIGGGVYHANASWSGTPPMHMLAMAGGPRALWAVLLSGGGGFTLALGGEMSLFLEARAVLASPNPVLYTNDGRQLKTADPSLLLSLGLQRAF
jgi:hypothetical protein